MATGLTNLSKKGPRFDFYDRQTVTWSTFGHDGYSGDGYNPSVIIPFSTQGLMFILESGGVIEISFDGINTGLRLDTAFVASGTAVSVQFDNRVNSLIWFKAISGSPIIQTIAWGIR